MAELNTLFVTFNCARELANADFFAASITQNLSKELLPPDVIVLSLQELAPISYSFLGGSFLAPYFDRFLQAVQKATKSWGHEGQYEAVLTSNLGMTALMLFARPEVVRRIGHIETAGTGVGLWEMGNKGAVGARLGYSADGGQELDLTFVAAHLAPHEGAWVRRNKDWRDINENLVFTGAPKAEAKRAKLTNGDSGEMEPLISSTTDNQHTRDVQTHAMITPNSYLFFGGDLNYRTSDLPPHPEDHRVWPRRHDSPSDPQHYSHLMPRDQLVREKAAGKTLHSLSEAAVTFPPTYKYSHKAQAQAAQAAEHVSQQMHSSNADTVVVPDETDWHWAAHRHPSWCDRILFFLPGRQPTVHNYTSLPLQPSSDHKPVILHCSIPLQSSQSDTRAAAPFPIRPGWKARREAARRMELGVGILAYLVLTWEGKALLFGALLGAIGGWAMLRSLLAY